MDFTKLRAWYWHKQGLDGSLKDAPPASILERAGWARSVGGVNPYMTLFARGGTDRQQAEDAAAALDIYELPSARGCTYVVPASDFALALKVGQTAGDPQELATAKKFLGVTDDEVEKLSAAVLEALGAGEKDPAALRALLGDTVRNLGNEGKKRGQTTTLPLALGLLQSYGRIRRVSVDGRLDQQRYRYARWGNGPLTHDSMSLDDAYVALARRYFAWTGPATAAHFRWFSSLGVGAAKKALEPLGLVDIGEGWLLAPEDCDAWESFQASAEPSYALVSGLDSLILLRRDLASLMDTEAASGTQRIAGSALGSPDLEDHAIFDRGRLAGLWQYDPEAQQIVWVSFEPASEVLRAAVLRTETFIRDQLGDARSFSLDSPKSRQPRLQALREMAS